MDKQDLAKQLEYSSSEWLYVVTWANELKQIFCPFKVTVISPIGHLKKGQTVWVNKVKVTVQLKTVFVINESAYYYYHFDILVD